MLIYHDFINEEIINTNNESGVVLSFDKERIVIKYQTSVKIYNPDIAFKSGFLTFKNIKLQQIINDDLLNKEESVKQKEKDEADANRIYFARKKRVNEMHKRMCEKVDVLLYFFGRDFTYPPLKEFEKKYECYVSRRYR